MTDEQKSQSEQEVLQQQIDNRFWFMSDVQRDNQGIENVIFFSKQDIQKAKHNQEFFEQKVLDVVDRYPHVIFSALTSEITKNLFSHEQIVTAVKKLEILNPQKSYLTSMSLKTTSHLKNKKKFFWMPVVKMMLVTCYCMN
jgi:hypothetical protein